MFIAQVFAMLAGGQPAGRLFPSTYGLIVGGAYASIIFSILYIQAAMGTWAEYTASDDDSNEVAQMRKLALWGRKSLPRSVLPRRLKQRFRLARHEFSITTNATSLTRV